MKQYTVLGFIYLGLLFSHFFKFIIYWFFFIAFCFAMHYTRDIVFLSL